jgi:hypothetical protein
MLDKLRFLILNFCSSLYGQDYNKIVKYVDFITIMSYENLYKDSGKRTWLDIIKRIFNHNYNPSNIAKSISSNTHSEPSRIIPILWAYNNPAEISYNRMPTKEELQKAVDENKDNCILFLYRDIKTKGENLLEVKL